MTIIQLHGEPTITLPEAHRAVRAIAERKCSAELVRSLAGATGPTYAVRNEKTGKTTRVQLLSYGDPSRFAFLPHGQLCFHGRITKALCVKTADGQVADCILVAAICQQTGAPLFHMFRIRRNPEPQAVPFESRMTGFSPLTPQCKSDPLLFFVRDLQFRLLSMLTQGALWVQVEKEVSRVKPTPEEEKAIRVYFLRLRIRVTREALHEPEAKQMRRVRFVEPM